MTRTDLLDTCRFGQALFRSLLTALASHDDGLWCADRVLTAPSHGDPTGPAEPGAGSRRRQHGTAFVPS